MSGYPGIYLEWWDSSGDARRWIKVVDLATEPVLIKTMGFLVAETKHALVVAAHLAHGYSDGTVNEVDSPMTIPRACIKRRKMLSP